MQLIFADVLLYSRSRQPEELCLKLSDKSLKGHPVTKQTKENKF